MKMCFALFCFVSFSRLDVCVCVWQATVTYSPIFHYHALLLTVNVNLSANHTHTLPAPNPSQSLLNLHIAIHKGENGWIGWGGDNHYDHRTILHSAVHTAIYCTLHFSSTPPPFVSPFPLLPFPSPPPHSRPYRPSSPPK